MVDKISCEEIVVDGTAAADKDDVWKLVEVKGAIAEIASEEVDAEKVVARELGKRSKSKLIVFPGIGCCRQPSSRTCK